MKQLDKAELERELNSKIKELYQQIESTGSEFNARYYRKVARLAAKLAESIRNLIEDDPYWEHWWQQCRLERGCPDEPTLYVFAQQMDKLAEFFNYVADGLIKERKLAKKAVRKP
jgi:hypothetical protein